MRTIVRTAWPLLPLIAASIFAACVWPAPVVREIARAQIAMMCADPTTGPFVACGGDVR